MKDYLHDQLNWHWFSIEDGGFEFPLAYSLKRCLNQQRLPADHMSLDDISMLVDDRVDDDDSADPRLARKDWVIRLGTVQKTGRLYVASDPERFSRRFTRNHRAGHIGGK
jgi:hypothetical protein